MAQSTSNVNLKIVFLGSAFVGKTAVINRYCNDTFSDGSVSTIGAGFFTRTEVIGEEEITMTLWDTAGEERFRSVTPSLLRGANGLVLVFDLTSANSFHDIDIYLDMFLDSCKVDTTKPLPVLLLGNKNDLENKVVPDEMIQRWKERANVKLYFPVSAKTRDGIAEAMLEFLKELITIDSQFANGNLFKLLTEQTDKENTYCCF